jgi:hypothetical protein
MKLSLDSFPQPCRSSLLTSGPLQTQCIAVRDIRQDLEERLSAIESDRTSLQKQIEALQLLEASVRMMLAQEELRVHKVTADRPELPFGSTPLVGGMQITDLIKSTLRRFQRRVTFDEVRDEVLKTPFDFQGQKPGRVVHGGLLSLLRTAEIDKVEYDRYGIIASNNGIPVQEAQLAQ